ncbi:DNA polymerase [Pilimelia terevasa]|uniref:DNA polymerase n=2 Tax=Pilimelia terevasa TaxID=53372 RepID=A0A8J3FK14_9ACTN|nr:DNA polymerase [Pilimelia terevasa]
MVLWCPDWPIAAAEIVDGVPAHTPVAVLYANRVVSCSPAARAQGVARGLRRREAQYRCPELTVLGYDPGRDARAFEPVVAAVAEVAAGVQVLRPGACALAARGPARHCGGEAAAAERIIEQVAAECLVESQVGVADGAFAAGLAARAGQLVPPGGTAAFLAGLDVGALGRPPLVDLLRRLGVRTLGAFAALPAADVLARFGADAAWAHRLAAGRDPRPLAVRQPPPDLAVSASYEDPLDRVDAAAFAARGLAARLHERLAAHGLACTRLGIEAVTATGLALHRTWRHDGLLTAAAIADRVRWQLDGWLTPARGDAARPTSGLVALRLVPDGVVRQAGQQPGLWGEAGEGGARADRALSRVQGLLGFGAVVTAFLGGGRSPDDRPRYVPWGEDRPAGDDAPWPGRLPAPAPAVVPPVPVPAEVRDAAGAPVTVSARLALSAPPALLLLDRRRLGVTGWAGPWPVDERWWTDSPRRQARFQLTLADGRAALAALTGGRWEVRAFYD